MPERLLITPKAVEVVHRLRAEHGKLMFHQSGGCCDGSSPMCYRQGEFKVGDSDVLIGEIEGCDFYIAKDQYAAWQSPQILVDITAGRGASFSLEIPLGVRFLIRGIDS